MRAFSAGKPQLVVPFADDQSENAERVARTGAGIRLTLEEYCDKGAIRLTQLIESRSVNEISQWFASRMSMQNAPQTVAGLLEGLSGINSRINRGKNAANGL